MNSRIISILLCFMVLLTSSREDSVAVSSTPKGSESENLSTDPPSERRSRADEAGDVAERDSSDRQNHSRMVKTTLGYDEWWFLTTSRPFISYKDFPGRPGVASWKEISHNSSTDARKSRKMNGPTAAEVTSNGYKTIPPSMLFLINILILQNLFWWT